MDSAICPTCCCTCCASASDCAWRAAAAASRSSAVRSCSFCCSKKLCCAVEILSILSLVALSRSAISLRNAAACTSAISFIFSSESPAPPCADAPCEITLPFSSFLPAISWPVHSRAFASFKKNCTCTGDVLPYLRFLAPTANSMDFTLKSFARASGTSICSFMTPDPRRPRLSGVTSRTHASPNSV